jgi:hypothetical protein
MKRCNRCGQISDLANTPNPPGWQCLADTMHGTLASIDFCPSCMDEMGIGTMLRQAVRDRAVGALKAMIPDTLPELASSLHIEQIIEKIEAGEYDKDFDSGDGINFAAASADTTVDDIAEAVLVDD